MGSQQHPAPTQLHYTINGKWVGETNYPDTAEGLTQNQETLLASEAEGHLIIIIIIIIIIFNIIVIKLGEKDKEVKSAGQCGTRGQGGDNGPQVHATQQSRTRDPETKTTPQPFDKLRREHDRHFTIIMITIVIVHHHGCQRLITHLPLVRIGQGDTCWRNYTFSLSTST